jgi:UDP-N-acetylmuramoylalanine--D-glutamate ligase
VAAKQRIFSNQTPDDILVYDIDDPGAASAVAPATATRVPVSGSYLPEGGNGPEEGSLIIGEVAVARPQLDRAFTMDLVAAATMAQHLGANEAGIGAVVDGFVPGDHRRTVVGEWGGVAWVNDSKATNPHAAVASAAAYDSVVLIAGGRNKGLDLAPIVAVPSVKAVIGIGEAAKELEVVTDPARYRDADDLGHAVELADRLAQPGDTVLLAPGCASFDMFDSYAARGDTFAASVRDLKGGTNGN